jgi:hypothetical protein
LVGQSLHEFDLTLCEYAFDNILRSLRDPGFAALAVKLIPPGVLAYCRALGREEPDEPLTRPRLLSLRELTRVCRALRDYPHRSRLRWWVLEDRHRDSIRCVAEIRCRLSGVHAEEWARTSRRCARRLQKRHLPIHRGLAVIQHWVSELRRYLTALGAMELLPRSDRTLLTLVSASPSPPSRSEPGYKDPQALDAMREAIRRYDQENSDLPPDKRGCHAATKVLMKFASIQHQRARDALRELQRRGEYDGFARRRAERYLQGRPNER